MSYTAETWAAEMAALIEGGAIHRSKAIPGGIIILFSRMDGSGERFSAGVVRDASGCTACTLTKGNHAHWCTKGTKWTGVTFKADHHGSRIGANAAKWACHATTGGRTGTASPVEVLAETILNARDGQDWPFGSAVPTLAPEAAVKVNAAVVAMEAAKAAKAAEEARIKGIDARYFPGLTNDD